MELSLEYWYLFPISMAVATIAMSTGIGGAVFFSPIFLLWLKLEPSVAIGVALITELFGFGSGLAAYRKSKLIDFKLGTAMLMISVPATIVGVLVAEHFPPIVLKAVFGVGIMFIGIQIFTSWRQEQKEKMNKEIEDDRTKHTSSITDASGKTYHYTVCNKPMGRAFAGFGGVFLGMISVGLAELMEYHLVAKCKVPSPVAVATSIFVVVVTVLFASAGHIYGFVQEGPKAFSQALNVAIFTAPGVVLGGQLGPRVQAKVDPDKMKVAISVIFLGVGILMLYTLTL